MANIIRLPLKHAYNVRELGGYITKDSKTTKWKQFLRSDALTNIDEADSKLLNEFGIKTVIDLRSLEETERNPDNMTYLEDVDYINISLMGDIIDEVTREALSADDISVGDFYIGLLKQKELIRSVLESIAGAKEGGILFHCHAGKDRTGVIAMLLLGIAKVYTQDIITNYQITFTNLNMNDFFSDDMFAGTPFVQSRPEFMIKTVLYLEEKYGSIEDYVRSTGISESKLELIKNRIV